MQLIQNGVHGQASAAQNYAIEPKWNLVQLPIGRNLSATSSVNESSMRTMQKELRRALSHVQQIEQGRIKWSNLYARHRFFQHHRHYIQLDFLACSANVMENWFSWNRIHLHELVVLFESLTDRSVEVRPWPEVIDFRDPRWSHAKTIFLGLNMDKVKPMQGEDGKPDVRLLDLREVTLKFIERISAWPHAGQLVNQFDLLIRHVGQSDMKSWLESHQQALQSSHDKKIGKQEETAGGFQ